MNGSVSYRDARIEDAAAIAAFLQERFTATFGHLYPPQDLADFTAKHFTPDAIAAGLVDGAGADRIALLDGTIIAVAQIGPHGLPLELPAEAGAYELKRLYLADSAKGTGVADALMTWAFARASAFGARVMLLSVWSENYRAQRFYARHGFVKCADYKFPVGATLDDEWIMRAPIAG